MAEGIVLEFDQEKGHGLIEAENGEKLPVHRNDFAEESQQGLYSKDIVEYTLGRNRFGKRAAKNVRRIGWEEGDTDEDGPPREWSF